MFDPFATTKPEGVGLGLAMCQRVAEQMQGSITWQRRDDWTEFHMQLPIRIEE
jgi:nitrogen-specific signal transduction histidine kinase